jgi:seryl-tRNA synthetase
MDTQILTGLYSRRSVLEKAIEDLSQTLKENTAKIQELTKQNESITGTKTARESKLTLLNQQIESLENTLKSLSSSWLSAEDDDDDEAPVVAEAVAVPAPAPTPVEVPVKTSSKTSATKKEKAPSMAPFEYVFEGDTYMVDPKTNQVTITDEDGIAEVGTWNPDKKEIVFFTEEDA